MGLAVWATSRAILPVENETLSGLLMGVAASIAVGLCIFGIMSHVIKSQELNYVLVEVRKGIGRK
jgi:hypothetical protein